MLPTTPYQFDTQGVPTFQPYTPIQNMPEVVYITSPEGANNYNLGPNKVGVLFSQGMDEMYIFSTDATGRRTQNDFVYTPKAKDSKSEYVTKGEFDKLKAKVDKLSTDNQKAPKKTTQKATEVLEDE